MSDALAVVVALHEAIAQERADAVKACLAEREAWARLVTATKRVGAESKLGDPALFAAAIVEYEKARDALSALGVDVDTLLEAA